MKSAITALLILFSTFSLLAIDEPVAVQDVARRVLSALQNGQASQLKSNLLADTIILEKGAKDFPSDPLIHFALASSYMAQEKLEAAVQNMEIAYTNSNKDVGAGTMYALALKMNKQPFRAYTVVRELSELHSDNPQLQNAMATFAIMIQKYDVALPLIETLLQEASADIPPREKSTLLFMQGACYLYKADHFKAIDAFEKARSIIPRMAVNLPVLGEAYLKSGNLEKASEVLDGALSINAGYPHALFYKGIICEKTGNSERAKSCFQNAYKLQKQRLRENGEDYYLMFLICQKLAKNDEGKTYKAEAAKLLFTFEAPWK